MDADPDQLAVGGMEVASSSSEFLIFLTPPESSTPLLVPTHAVSSRSTEPDVLRYRAVADTRRIASELLVVSAARAVGDRHPQNRLEQLIASGPNGLRGGWYRLLRCFPKRRTMELGAKGILVVFVERLAVVPEEIFDAWYDMHVKEILSAGYYHSAFRLMLRSGSLPTYLAVYETHAAPGEAADALAEMRDRWSLLQDYGDPTDVKIRGAFFRQRG